MLYLDKLAMLAVLGFALGLAWMTVPPSNLHARSIQAMPLKGAAALGATYEFKLPSAVRAKCAGKCTSLGENIAEPRYAANEREQFAQAMRVAYTAHVTPLHR
ncbi:hypothetical protein HED22_17485 [Thalassospira sp. HF15]|uniref:hypothetical protein n=1 Tax=Thalassospira sp. HF15 TaxID=2722755 RepID=UPI001430921F|nr:hypothetical protein [Thalassospira sp. HF15]NIY77448.1 hypothetical protein [Thalassospira sp. HF15]